MSSICEQLQSFDSRLDLIEKRLWAVFNPTTAAASIIPETVRFFKSSDTRDVILDDETFTRLYGLLKDDSYIMPLHSLVTNFNKSTPAEIKASIKTLLKVSELAIPNFKSYFDDNEVFLCRSIQWPFSYKLSDSPIRVLGSKDLPNRAWYRVAKDLEFTEFDASLAKFLQLWTIATKKETQNKVAEWFEKHRNFIVSIYTIYYITRAFEDSSRTITDLKNLEEIPLKWLEALDS